ncbi:malonyl-CoA-acyl carrier protein transacylase, mitochondrial isoform 3-T3 [Odontesthes bonariensis]|uniref:malonyl-CoA-acyl carrier protein transacylase, mitochondrial isoform X3 n=1 Tax=Odontesthes bonariensis TaxID=219752 RepID=UPI003F586E69
MLASKAVSMAASRRKVRSLVSLSRRLSTNLPDTPDTPPGSQPPVAQERRPKKDPNGCSVLLFPGQGSQFVGMGRGLLKYPNVKEMFSVAQKILGYDLLSLCLEGPEEDLQKTVHCQPAVFVTSLAAVERLHYENPKAKEHCKSLGVQEPVCSVANYLFPDGRVIAGHQQALDFLQQNSRRLQFIRTKPLPVSGAFHTELMASATEQLRDVLRQVEVRRPEISVYSNVDGKRYMSESHMRRQLVKQLVLPVKWEQTLHEIYERMQGERFPHTYEVGPGRQLGATLQKCNRKAFQMYAHVEVTTHEE